MGCYLLAGRFWGPGAGLAAAALATFAPPVQALAHQALVDLALAAMVVFAYGCWVRSERFSRLDWSLMFGLAAGIGCLVKWTRPLYLLPVVGAGVWGLVTGRHRKNIFLALVLSIIVTAPWYAANLFIVVPKLTRVAGLGAQEGDPSGRTLAGWLWYLRILLVQWGGPFLLAGVAGLGWGFFSPYKRCFGPCLWFVFKYGIWSSVSNKRTALSTARGDGFSHRTFLPSVGNPRAGGRGVCFFSDLVFVGRSRRDLAGRSCFRIVAAWGNG